MESHEQTAYLTAMNAMLLLDLDGTLYEGDRLIPGVIAMLGRVRNAGIPVRFVTNTTRKPRQDVYHKLRGLGIESTLDELYTAPVAAATFLKAEGVQRIALLMTEATHQDFEGFEITDKNPEALVVGDLGAAWDFTVLNRGFRALMSGAALVAVQKNRYWKDHDGLSLDAGPFVAALEYASGKTANVVGKPSAAFFQGAVRSAGIRVGRATMVGDDIYGDVAGAQSAGAKGILVRTGKFRQKELEQSGVIPDCVIDSVADLSVEMIVGEG